MDDEDYDRLVAMRKVDTQGEGVRQVAHCSGSSIQAVKDHDMDGDPWSTCN